MARSIAETVVKKCINLTNEKLLMKSVIKVSTQLERMTLKIELRTISFLLFD